MAENPSLTYALQPAKLYVCASYSGDPQDAAAAPLKSARGSGRRSGPIVGSGRERRRRAGGPPEVARETRLLRHRSVGLRDGVERALVGFSGRERARVEVRPRRWLGCCTLKGGPRSGPRRGRLVGSSLEGRDGSSVLYNWKVGSLETECSSANASLSSASILT